MHFACNSSTENASSLLDLTTNEMVLHIIEWSFRDSPDNISRPISGLKNLPSFTYNVDNDEKKRITKSGFLSNYIFG